MAPNQSATRDVRGSETVCPRESETNSQGRITMFFQKSWAHKLLPMAVALAATLALAVSLKVVCDIGPIEKESAAISGIPVPNKGPGPEAFEKAGSDPSHVAGSFRRGLYLIMAAIVISFGGILALFIRKFVIPLNAISDVVRAMADGDLTVSAPDNLPDDMKPLANGLNDLAANFQEALLFTGATCGNLSNQLEALDADLSRDDPRLDKEDLKATLSAVRGELETLSEMVEQFRYFQADFDGKEVKPR
jgi:methyl-accepting chemotaxis protein